MLVNKRIISTITGLALGSLLLIGAVIVPTVLSIGNLEKKIAEQNAEIERRYAARQLVRDTMTALDENRNLIAGLRRTAVIEGEELALVNAIESIQEKTGVDVDIEMATVNQKDISKWEREIPLKLTVFGDYDDVLKFIEEIERLPYLVMIDTLDVSGANSGTKPKPGTVSAHLNGAVYWISKDAPAFVMTGTISQLPER